MNLNRRRRRWIFTLLLLTLAVLSAFAFVPRSRPLRDRARQITRIADMDSYFWLSNQQVLLLRTHATSSGTDAYNITILDIVTGKETPQSALSALWNRQGQSAYGPHLSPNGKWLLWESMQGGLENTDRRAMLASLDDKRHFECPIGYSLGVDAPMSNNLLWTGDGDHWLELAVLPKGIKKTKEDHPLCAGNLDLLWKMLPPSPPKRDKSAEERQD